MLALSGEQPIVRNSILAGLPPADFACIRPFLQAVALRERTILQEPKRRIEYVNFIESGLVSFRTLASESILEIAMAGSQGATGLSVALGWELSAYQAIVLVPTRALRIRVDDLRRAIEMRPLIREHLLRHVNAIAIHYAQTALCGVRHELEPRLASWLCLACDIVGNHALPVTHEYLATILGLRRAGVTEALNRFEASGLLCKTRGALEVRDRKHLEERTCGCYQIVADAYRAANSLCKATNRVFECDTLYDRPADRTPLYTSSKEG
jgi:CRP-like cAMP-binding protein